MAQVLSIKAGLPKSGIEAETVRALASYNGASVMMDNVRRFSDGNPGTICLADITPSDGNDWSAEAAAGWQRIADALELAPLR